MSERPSTVSVTGWPATTAVTVAACSGDMYSGVPPSHSGGGAFGQRVQEAVQGGPAEIRHGQGLEVAVEKVLHQVEGGDVRVLQPGQGEMLLSVTGGELEDERSVGQGGL